MGIAEPKGDRLMDAMFITALLAATIRLGMAIGLAAIGEAAAERSGIFNIGIEGVMLSGAFVAAWGSVRTGSPWLGMLFAMIIGLILAGIHAFMVLVLRIDQFVSGIGMVIFGLGFSSFAARLTIGAKPTSVHGLRIARSRRHLAHSDHRPDPVRAKPAGLHRACSRYRHRVGHQPHRVRSRNPRLRRKRRGRRDAGYSGQTAADRLHSVWRHHRRSRRRLSVRGAGRCVR